jgi:hypothetical protein
MTSLSETVWLPSSDESIGPVTILDAQGRVVRVVSAEEFRRARPTATADRVDDLRPLATLRGKRTPRRVSSAAAPALPHAVGS